MHHVLANLFETIFGFQQNLSSKLLLLLVEKVSLFYKNILVSKGKVFQNSLNIFPFHKESNFNPLSQLNLIQTLFIKRFKTSHFEKGMTKSLQKNKSFDFDSTKWFLNQRSLAQFCFKGL